MMFFRSGFIGYYDLYKDSGTQHFAGQRLGCWINAIPGNGLVMIPEASAGCVCQFSIASTVVLEPKPESSAWGILSAVGPSTPVKRLGINLGAPGIAWTFTVASVRFSEAPVRGGDLSMNLTSSHAWAKVDDGSAIMKIQSM